MKRAGWGAEFRWIANITLARRRDVLQPRRGAHAGFIGRGEENLCGDSRWQVVLLAMKNRNFSPSLSRPCLRATASSPRVTRVAYGLANRSAEKLEIPVEAPGAT